MKNDLGLVFFSSKTEETVKDSYALCAKSAQNRVLVMEPAYPSEMTNSMPLARQWANIEAIKNEMLWPCECPKEFSIDSAIEE